MTQGRIIRAPEKHECEIGGPGEFPPGTLVECAECGIWWRVEIGDYWYWGRPSRRDRKKIAALDAETRLIA